MCSLSRTLSGTTPLKMLNGYRFSLFLNQFYALNWFRNIQKVPIIVGTVLISDRLTQSTGRAVNCPVSSRDIQFFPFLSTFYVSLASKRFKSTRFPILRELFPSPPRDILPQPANFRLYHYFSQEVADGRWVHRGIPKVVDNIHHINVSLPLLSQPTIILSSLGD